MQLPSSLQKAIESVAETLGLNQLIQAREELTQRYRQPKAGSQYMTTDAQRQSYVVSRMPATYAALQEALKAVRQIVDLPIQSLLDLGAGPGTGMWAACDHFPSIERVTLLEKDKALLDLGRELAQCGQGEAVQTAHWEEADLEKLSTLPPHDLVVLSYSIGELHPDKVASLIDLSWKAANQLLLIVEPGTPVGFERIRRIRQQLIERGAYLIAPCPHASACPMQGGDWCHFAARVERTSLHRRLKGGSLGYEDEKFSYLAVAKTPFRLPASRILRHPDRHSGHTMLTLCTLKGLEHSTISKKMGDLYKQARKAEWGDAFPLS